MDKTVQDSIRLVESKARRSWPWEFDEPYRQPYYVYDDNSWHPTNQPSYPIDPSIQTLAVYSWNIDFMLPFADSRMQAAIAHLESLVSKQPSHIATAIFLAECVDTDLALLSSHGWIQRTFALTDLDKTHWQSGHYGTTTLVDKRLPIKSCFRVHFSQTRMERDGLFVDIAWHGSKTVRLCNTHLESLALQPPFRPPQMALCAKYMRDPSIHGAVLAGDLNAIQDFDKKLHSDNGLMDAYLDRGGREEDVAGHTWGQQAATAQRNRFGTSRMDKVFFCGGLQCVAFEQFGAGVEVEDASEREAIVKLGFDRPWITDHLGVKGVFKVG